MNPAVHIRRVWQLSARGASHPGVLLPVFYSRFRARVAMNDVMRRTNGARPPGITHRAWNFRYTMSAEAVGTMGRTSPATAKVRGVRSRSGSRPKCAPWYRSRCKPGKNSRFPARGTDAATR